MCCSIATQLFCLCKKCFEEYDQTNISFISLTNENKNSKDDYDNDDGLQETQDSDDNVTVDGGYFYKE